MNALPIIAHDVAGTGSPILFIHGFLLSRELWSDVIHVVTRAHPNRWRCIAPDLRGFGSTAPMDPWSIANHADDLAALLDHLRVREPVVLVGLSMGGIVAMEFLARHHDRVRALVLTNCRVHGETPAGVARWDQMARTALDHGAIAAGGAMLDAAFAPDAPEPLRTRWRTILARTPTLGIAAGARALRDRPDHTPTLATVTVPTMVVCGEQDVVTPISHMRTIADMIPGSRFIIIPGAGHLSPAERPGSYGAALTELFSAI